jgi:hypothetical protein
MPILLLEGRIVPCVFCGSPGVGKYLTPSGCLCRADDREQVRCAQHVERGGMDDDDEAELIEIYYLQFYKGYFGNAYVEKYLVPDLVRGV